MEKNFQRFILPGQCPDFKIISQKCSSHGPLPKLLKWFRSAKQNGRHSQKSEKPLNDISSQASG